MSGTYLRTTAFRERMSVLRKGRPGIKGRRMSEETKARLSAARQGFVMPKEWRMNRRGNGNPAYKHGHSSKGARTLTYITWESMLKRCFKPTHKGYKNYGGRGITVCGRWLIFTNFLSDMGERGQGLTLDRMNNDGNYEPGNCRWATSKEQRANKRRVKG